MSPSYLLVAAFIPTIRPYLVETSYGILDGLPIQSRHNIPCWIFKGVPFARPPVGDRRFRVPEPPESWSGVRPAKKYSAACMSNSTVTFSPQKYISEDCLYLNIFTSERCLSKQSSCPVIFYIHGGILNFESAVMFDDQFITDRYSSKDIVFVISAFRLGFFGVLSFGNDDVVPRNLALYDIIAGLEFVHQEVAAFGGNPNRVTVMGHSQGASIAMIFAASSVVDPNKRLFQQLVALSPAVNYCNASERADLTWKLAYRVGCTATKDRPTYSASEEIASVVTCLRATDAYTLLAKQRSLEEEGLSFEGVLFAPPFVEDGSSFKDFWMNSVARPMICSSTKAEFNFLHNDETYEIGAFLVVKHPKEVRRKYFGDKRAGRFRDSYLSQVVFTLNVLFGSIFDKKGSKVYLMEYNQGPFPFHSIDMPLFIGAHLRKLSKNENIIGWFYAKSLVNFAYGRIPHRDWHPFKWQTKNYYALEANLDKRLLPSNKYGYHSAVVDYWLKNMTEFDENLSRKSRSGLFITDSRSNFSREILIAALFGLGATFMLTMLLAICSYLSPRDRPLHERSPLILRKGNARNIPLSIVNPTNDFLR